MANFLVTPIGGNDFDLRLSIDTPTFPAEIRLNEHLCLTRIAYAKSLRFDLLLDLHESQSFRFLWANTKSQRWCNYTISLTEEKQDLLLRFVHDKEPICPLQLGGDDVAVLTADRPFAELQLNSESLLVVRQRHNYYVLLLVPKLEPDAFIQFKQCFPKLCVFAGVPQVLTKDVIEALAVRVPWGWDPGDALGVLRWGHFVFRLSNISRDELGLRLQDTGEVTPDELFDALPLPIERLGSFNTHGLVCNYLGRNLVMFEYGVPFTVQRGTLAMLHHSAHGAYLHATGMEAGHVVLRVDEALVVSEIKVSLETPEQYWVPSGECRCTLVALETADSEFTATLQIDPVVYPNLELDKKYQLQSGEGLQGMLEMVEDKQGGDKEDNPKRPPQLSKFVIKYGGKRERSSAHNSFQMSFEYEFNYTRLRFHLGNYHDRHNHRSAAPPLSLGLTAHRYALVLWDSDDQWCTLSIVRNADVAEILAENLPRESPWQSVSAPPDDRVSIIPFEEDPATMVFCGLFSPGTYRWVLAVAGFIMQFALGSVYGWSVFTHDISAYFYGSSDHGLTAPISFTLSIALLVIGLTAVMAGQINHKIGPRYTGSIAGLLYGLGLVLAGVCMRARSIAALYITYGLIGGVGIGLGYVVPLAVLLPWFPDKRGFIMGLSVTGFGGGALILAQVVPSLLHALGVEITFVVIGVFYCAIVVGVSQFFVKVPPGKLDSSRWKFMQQVRKNEVKIVNHVNIRRAFRTSTFYVLWMALMLNICAGAALISVAAPLAVEFCNSPTQQASWFVSTIAIFNGVGRVFWAWLSDRITRPITFLCLFVSQAIAFIMLVNVPPDGFGMLVVAGAIIGLDFGGGFGTMPAFVGDMFGDKRASAIYGVMLTAWSAGGLIGPLLMTLMNFRTAFYVLLAFMIIGCGLCGILWRDLKLRQASALAHQQSKAQPLQVVPEVVPSQAGLASPQAEAEQQHKSLILNEAPRPEASQQPELTPPATLPSSQGA